MWLLSCDGDLFRGRRLWLRPGTTHLLGRTTQPSENGERIQHIDNKSVSRKHLIIAVAATRPEDVSRLHVKSQLTLTDGSKKGTTINGNRITGEERTLGGSTDRETQFKIKLGTYEHEFLLEWQPVVISITSLGKKGKDAALAAHQQKFEQTDVKVLAEFVSSATTHCVVKKRNTPTTLQALLLGKWLVTDDYVDAVARTVQRDSNDESPLETDFDSAWPKEDDYPIPAANEPHPRADEFLKPDPKRAEVFHNFVFVFFTQSQYDILLPVVTSGGGKALLYELHANTTLETVVEYLQGVAGHKRTGRFSLSQQPGAGGVVIVRSNDRDETKQQLTQSVDRAFDQRSIEQSEFLDPILTLDTSGLLRPLPEATQESIRDGESRHQAQVQELSQHSRTNANAAETSQRRVQDESSRPGSRSSRYSQVHDQLKTAAQSSQMEVDQVPEQSQRATEPAVEAGPPKKRTRRFITQSRFTGFDDFDPSQFTKPASQPEDRSFDAPPASQAASVQEMDVDAPSQRAATQMSSRKRRASPVEEEDEEDMYAGILTGQNAFKKRRLAEGKNVDPATIQTDSDRRLAEKAAKRAKKAEEMDVMAEIQARRKREEEEYRKNEEALRDALDGVEIEDIKNRVQIEDMDVPVRDRPARRDGRPNGGTGERWDPTWNGRKNFKRFRRQGDGDAPRLPRVIVALEEVPRKGHGLGEDYYLTNTSTSSRNKSNKSKSQSQSQSQRATATSTIADEEDDDTTRFRRRLQASYEEDGYNDATSEILPDEIAGRPRDEALQAVMNASAVSRRSGNSTPSQTFGTDTQRRAAGKRPAAEPARAPPAKRTKQSQLASARASVVIDDDDDDEDDGLKFRRRRK